MGTVLVRETVTKIKIKEVVVWHVQALVREIIARLKEVPFTTVPVARGMPFA
jgi:hypothetical protein